LFAQPLSETLYKGRRMCFSSVQRPFGRYRRSLWREDVYVWRTKRIRFMAKTYTFHARNVYVFIARRIRFVWDRYTFCSSRVYVWPYTFKGSSFNWNKHQL